MSEYPDEEDIEFGVLEEIIIVVRDASPRVPDDAASADIAEAIWNAGFRRVQESDWEYGTRCPMPECTEPHLLDESDAPPQPEESLWRRTRERHVPPGEWVPVNQEQEETE